MQKTAVLSIDQGTTSSRVIAFSPEGEILAIDQQDFNQYFPRSGWVEHDASEIFRTVVQCLETVLNLLKSKDVTPVTVGITNQRETIVCWDRTTGEPLAPAIVWQDRRTQDLCERLKAEGSEPTVQKITGLLLDPYFSGTKIAWLLQNNDKVRAKLEVGQLACGTIESYLVYRLTGGTKHITDATNASRTMLMDIHNTGWSETMLKLLNVPESILPEIVDNAGAFGTITADLPGSGLPINGLIGDQQSALVGNNCFNVGACKATYGTGCFVLLNTGDNPITSTSRLLTTIGYQLDGKTTYALEGSIFNAGTVTQWLRDQMGIIKNVSEISPLVNSVPDTGGVYMVPAFTGLGAPHWRAEARGIITGLERSSSKAHLVRAAMESVGYQTADLLTAVNANFTEDIHLKVDGGMAANDWLMQFIADIANVPIERPDNAEATAFGAAVMAATGAGLISAPIEMAKYNAVGKAFAPSLDVKARQKLVCGWEKALSQCLL